MRYNDVTKVNHDLTGSWDMREFHRTSLFSVNIFEINGLLFAWSFVIMQEAVMYLYLIFPMSAHPKDPQPTVRCSNPKEEIPALQRALRELLVL